MVEAWLVCRTNSERDLVPHYHLMNVYKDALIGFHYTRRTNDVLRLLCYPPPTSVPSWEASCRVGTNTICHAPDVLGCVTCLGPTPAGGSLGTPAIISDYCTSNLLVCSSRFHSIRCVTSRRCVHAAPAQWRVHAPSDIAPGR